METSELIEALEHLVVDLANSPNGSEGQAAFTVLGALIMAIRKDELPALVLAAADFVVSIHQDEVANDPRVRAIITEIHDLAPKVLAKHAERKAGEWPDEINFD